MAVLIVPDIQAPLGEWAQFYAAQSWPVLPMHTAGQQGCSCAKGALCTSPGKHPRGDLVPKGRNDASTNTQTITTWWQKYPDAGIAIRTDTLLIIDLDARHQGRDNLRLLEQQYSDLPDCPRVLSGGGGEHFWYSLPADGLGVPSSDGLVGPGIDIKGYQGNINVPMTHHVSGKPYVWDGLFSLDAFPLVPPPQWLVDLARQNRTPHSGGSPNFTPGVLIPVGSRYHYLISAAGHSRAMGFNEAQIYENLLIANQNCEVLEDDKELRAYAKWASGKDIGKPYTLPPGMRNGTGPPPPPPGARTVFDFSTGETAVDLMRNVFMQPPEFLVAKLIPNGLTVLGAPAKSYKSIFALSLALATIGEGDWCDTFPVESTGPVVFFGLEAPQMQLRNRLHQLRASYTPDSTAHPLTFFSGMKALPTFKEGLQDAIEQIIEHYQPRLIVIDPLSYLYRLGRQDDLASATLDLLWPLAEMAAKANIAIFAPEHMRKRSKEDVSVVDQLAGSFIKAAVVHGLLMMRREGEDLIIETTMRDAASQELAITVDFDEQAHHIQWGYKGANAGVREARTTALKAQVLEEVKERGYPMKASDVMDALIDKGLIKNTTQTRDNIRQILYRGEQDRDLALSRRGEYYWIGPK